MATVAFTLPLSPMMISSAKKNGPDFFGILVNLLILAALGAFIWWFYKAMTKNAPPGATAPVVPEGAPPAANVPVAAV